MTDSIEDLRKKVDGARQLGTVVRAMKVLSSIGLAQYEESVESLAEYVQTIHLGLAACVRSSHPVLPEPSRGPFAAVVFGSDQGLVGGFNEVIAEAATHLLALHDGTCRLWVIGERLASCLEERGILASKTLNLPSSTSAIGGLVRQILVQVEESCGVHSGLMLSVLFNRASAEASYEPMCEQLLPFDTQLTRLAQMPWPTRNLPELIGPVDTALSAHLREYLFVSLFRACVESLASENASRLAAMQRAERNIGSLIDSLTQSFNGLRQSSIDEEIFDVIAGFEALGA